MATSQSSEPMGNPSRSFKSFTRAMRKSENHLLLATTYGLNNSSTKRIVVGLALRLNDKFEPVIRLIGDSYGGIRLRASTWSKLEDQFDLIRTYFAFDVNDGSQWSLEDIDVDEHCRVCFFTTAHNQRAIRFIVPNDRESQDAQPRPKKTRLLQPSIVMLKPAFEGLKAVYTCVGERVHRLRGLNADVNSCRDLYIDHVAAAVRLTGDYSLHGIGQTVSEVYGAAREGIARTYPDPVFVTQYLDIMLLELTSLLPTYITARAKQLVEQM